MLDDYLMMCFALGFAIAGAQNKANKLAAQCTVQSERVATRAHDIMPNDRGTTDNPFRPLFHCAGRKCICIRDSNSNKTASAAANTCILIRRFVVVVLCVIAEAVSVNSLVSCMIRKCGFLGSLLVVFGLRLPDVVALCAASMHTPHNACMHARTHACTMHEFIASNDLLRGGKVEHQQPVSGEYMHHVCQ